jgi:hypothetical protein
MRFILEIVIMVLAILGAYFTIGGSTGRGRMSIFLDLPSLIIVVIFPILFVIIVKGFSGIKTAFTIQKDKNASKETLIKANLALKMYGRMTWLASIMAIMIGAINFCANGEGIQALGPNLAFVLNSILYATLVNIIVVPFVTNTKERMENSI